MIAPEAVSYTHLNDKPTGIDGLRNAEWVAMDYSDVLVHVFLPETRNFYKMCIRDRYRYSSEEPCPCEPEESPSYGFPSPEWQAYGK